jgi:hypothetical protein
MRRLGVVAILLVLFLSGCATASGGVPGYVKRALEQSESAVSTSALALSQFEHDRVTSAVAETVLDDSLRELTAADSQVAELTVSTGREHALRAEALGAVRVAIDAVQLARSEVAGVTAIDPAEERASAALEDGRRALRSLMDRLP